MRDKKVFNLMRMFCSHVTLAAVTSLDHQAVCGCSVMSAQPALVTRNWQQSRSILCNYVVSRCMLADFEVCLC